MPGRSLSVGVLFCRKDAVRRFPPHCRIPGSGFPIPGSAVGLPAIYRGYRRASQGWFRNLEQPHEDGWGTLPTPCRRGVGRQVGPIARAFGCRGGVKKILQFEANIRLHFRRNDKMRVKRRVAFECRVTNGQPKWQSPDHGRRSGGSNEDATYTWTMKIPLRVMG